MRVLAAAVGVSVFGWALLAAAEARHVEPEVRTVMLVQTVMVEPEPAETPFADSVTDVAEAERQGACLWVWMREQDVELTLQSVLAAGYWTDELGGACLLIGEDG